MFCNVNLFMTKRTLRAVSSRLCCSTRFSFQWPIFKTTVIPAITLLNLSLFNFPSETIIDKTQNNLRRNSSFSVFPATEEQNTFGSLWLWFLIFRLDLRLSWGVEDDRRGERGAATWRWMEGERRGKKRSKWKWQQRETGGERRTRRRRPTFPSSLSWPSQWRPPQHEPSS